MTQRVKDMDFGLRRFCVKLTGNALVQRALDWNVLAAQYLMGVGAGSNVATSGEKAVVTLVRRRRPDGKLTVFDVGANQGQFCRLAHRQLLDRDVTIHAFEPSREAFAMLCEVARQIPGVQANNLALGVERGKGRLFYDRPASGLASLTCRDLRHHGLAFTLSEDVEVETVDGYCAARGVDRVDLLKIDVEGHELDVLLGASGMLGRGCVEVVTFEFGGCNIDTRTYFRDFFYLLSEYRMQVARITPSGYIVHLSRYREKFEQFITTNFVAMRT